MHTGCTFNHRYVKSNPREVENATWMLTVSVLSLFKILKLDLFSLSRIEITSCLGELTYIMSGVSRQGCLIDV